jgi:poly(3-hydroxybutyrate) depolymerase
MVRARSSLMTLATLSLLVGALACGDDAEPASDVGADTGADADAAGDTGSGDTGSGDTGAPDVIADTEEETGGLVDTGDEPDVAVVDPWVEVPPAALEAETTECAANYREDAPAAGQNDDYDLPEQTRSFYLALPDDQDGPAPLFVGFHGTGGTGASAFAEWQMQDFVDAGMIVLLPDGVGNGEIWPVWDALRSPGRENEPNPDLELFDSLIQCVAAHYPVDRNRIFMGGHSAGGIMSNHVLQRRSELLAGAIVASGVFDLTAPSPREDLAEVAVLVTWGGDNDQYSGSASGEVSVPEINFVEQAAAASGYYEAQEAVHQAHCYGVDLGHTWLDVINPWMAEFLLAHPNGLPEHNGYTLSRPDESTVNCRERAAEYVPPVVVECPAAEEVDACGTYCQFIGDCVVENGTAAPVLGPQLIALGFSGEDAAVCGGCVTTCEGDAQGESAAIDADVLSCLSEAAGTAVCAQGIDGVMPFINAINTCCDGETESALCTRACQTILENDVASSFFPTCPAFAPEE